MAAWVAWGRVPEAFWDHFEAILGRFSDQGGDDMVEFTWPSDAIKQSARQVGIRSYAGGRRRAKPLIQYKGLD